MIHVAELSMMNGIPSVSKVTDGALAAVVLVVVSATGDVVGDLVSRTF